MLLLLCLLKVLTKTYLCSFQYNERRHGSLSSILIISVKASNFGPIYYTSTNETLCFYSILIILVYLFKLHKVLNNIISV